jgi:hypothetical protein
MTTRKDSPYRPLTRHEREVLDKLLEPSFPGRDELLAQVKLAEAKEIDDDGCIEFSRVSAARFQAKSSIPTEGEYRDVDGTTLHVQLHVVDGFVKQLELYKEDGSVPTGLPPASELRVFAAHSKEAGTWNRDDKYK